MINAKICLLVFASGGCGALCRFVLSEMFNRLVSGRYPLGTFMVNIIGAFLFGLVWELAAGRMVLSAETRVILCSGFLGGFTTFSSLVFDSYMLGQTKPSLLIFNIAAQILLGFSCFISGVWAAKAL